MPLFQRKLAEKNLKYIGGIAKNRNLLFKTSSGKLDTIRIDEYAQWISNEEFKEIEIQGKKPRTVWVAIISVAISRLEGQRKIAIVMNAPVFEEAEDIDYLITNVQREIVTEQYKRFPTLKLVEISQLTCAISRKKLRSL